MPLFMTRILLALFSAILLILSFPNFDLGFLAWIALVPLLLALRNISLKSVLALSWISGICFFMGGFYWLNLVKGVTLLHYFVVVTYLGSYFALFGGLFTSISKRGNFPFIITAPVLWVSVEYLRSYAGFVAQPMNSSHIPSTKISPLFRWLPLQAFTGYHS
jgi:apolipoprotein N-acyltransferase